MKSHSIARRVVTLFLLVELLSALCMTGFVYLYERHTHFRSLDEAIHGRAALLLGAVVDAEDTADNVVLDLHGLQLPQDDLYEVWDNGSHLLGRSAGWAAPPRFGVRESAAVEDGAPSEITVNGVRYRLLRETGLRSVDPDTSNVPHTIVVVYASPTRAAWFPVAHAVRAFAIASLLLVLGSGLIVTLLVRSSMSPLKELAAQAGAISSSQWSFLPSPRARTTEELAPLVAALEDLIRRLQRAFDQQRQFVSDSAHELKTAVTVVKSSLQLLDLRARQPEEYRAGVLTSLVDCQRLEDLVHRMLTLARVEEGASLARADALPASELRTGVLHAMEAIDSLARMRGVQLEVAGLPLPAAIPAEDWQTICSNLLLNSVQHSPSGSRILVTVEPDGAYARCRFEDQGYGIAAEVLPFVCDRFYRGDASRARATGGSGLGLAICKALAERVHGELRIVSTVGQGTTVTVVLPRAQVSAELAGYAGLADLAGAATHGGSTLPVHIEIDEEVRVHAPEV